MGSCILSIASNRNCLVIRKGTIVLLATKNLQTIKSKMKFTVVVLLLALVACHQANGKARFGSVEGKAKGTSPRSMYEKTMMMDNESEEGCNCNDTGCDCPRIRRVLSNGILLWRGL